MSKIVILGAGISGHVAATHLRRKLSKNHEVVVVSPNSNYQWIPSNIWVGIGRMKSEQILFPLAPLYKRKGIDFKQAKAVSFYPEGDQTEQKPYVLAEYVVGEQKGQKEKITYDYLINATGPKLNFEATEGLIPGENSTYSVCTYNHAEHAWQGLKSQIELMKQGKKVKILIGTGHAKATCQGAAFEYILNVEQELRKHKVREMAEITWISNEYQLGDFGMDGMLLSYGNMTMKSSEMVEMIFEDRDIKWILGAGVNKIENGIAHYENLEGDYKSETYDFAMLIPSFSGHGFKAFDKNENEITEKLFKGFMIVDADYSPKPYEQWSVKDWPETYQNPSYKNIFAPGIAFAPPHTISKPRKSKNGTEIFPAPPRTGMPSGITAKLVADNIIDTIKNGNETLHHKGSMGNMGAACIASAGYGMTSGSGVSITTFPIVPDYEKYQKTQGRQLGKTFGEIGLAGHWLKLALHYAFIYKAKMRPFWWLIPE
ncbi:MAG: FAD-dependent oxidoreductase [Flavobacteriia bacterium]|nr:FAD-dependent oxidoreductase [Flavobacteriia bacterium]OIP46357.1 MAG: sulfide:quinone reductase [Flavobacteriaceae bacterium CG2_30_31_66]PIV95723.1 MAG: sulfide:quinone reductase [Flavobacteriaceae bacterium CG17_big_fil_post_rev_8_21_14_2_50_31_13]PIX11467.1 MAG: sulfide:quinone reductase [Flavobacteriaceae bacterium CG_4_8_14_3_um_filter_31_8]PIY15622.1 MAG: sulfide:quinone reductase [Flavobacteriaceae bacterium CG_4_10_14_3_um_filter_31_253]PIZ09293.1 MAG: sulfide:quinone reductase [Fl